MLNLFKIQFSRPDLFLFLVLFEGGTLIDVEMVRALRVEFPGATYHIMSRGINRCVTFRDDEDRLYFLKLLDKLCCKGSILIHAYALMSTHFHILGETPRGRLHRWMQWLLTTYTQRFNKRHGRIGGLWQGRYKAILVEDGEYFLTCSRYIHLNPVKDELVRQPEDYPWSSFRVFLDPEADTNLTVTTERTLAHFRSRRDYEYFVKAGSGEEEEDPLWKATAGIAFGSEDFVARIRKMTEEIPADPEVPSVAWLRRTDRTPDLERIRDATEEVCKDWSRCQKRRMYVFCLDQFTWLTRKQIASHEGITPSGVTRIADSVKERVSENQEWADRFQRIKRRVGS